MPNALQSYLHSTIYFLAEDVRCFCWEWRSSTFDFQIDVYCYSLGEVGRWWALGFACEKGGDALKRSLG